MKTQSGATKVITLVAIASVSLCALVGLAKEKAIRKPDHDYSIKLRMGVDGDGEALHCSRESLRKALSHNPDAAHKIHFHSIKDGKPDEDFGTGKAIGVPHPNRPGGVHSTQQIAFGDVKELTAFVNALKDEP
jgi:hypothetical protein